MAMRGPRRAVCRFPPPASEACLCARGVAGIFNGWVLMRPFRPQVIKTEQCSFSEFRIWPGHGMRYARRDGTVSASAVEHLRRECI